MKTRATLTPTQTPAITRRDLWLAAVAAGLSSRFLDWHTKQSDDTPNSVSIAGVARNIVDAMEAEEAKRQKQQPEASAT